MDFKCQYHETYEPVAYRSKEDPTLCKDGFKIAALEAEVARLKVALLRSQLLAARENTHAFVGEGHGCAICGNERKDVIHRGLPCQLAASSGVLEQVEKAQARPEFDPKSELHYPLLIVKVVDPGCTLELQIEVALTGKLVRISSTEFPKVDMELFVSALVSQFKDAWNLFKNVRR